MSPAFAEAAEQLNTQGYIEDRVRQQLSPAEYVRLTNTNERPEED
jgi:hypothetical protein